MYKTEDIYRQKEAGKEVILAKSGLFQARSPSYGGGDIYLTSADQVIPD